MTLESGWNVAVMAPTEILARKPKDRSRSGHNRDRAPPHTWLRSRRPRHLATRPRHLAAKAENLLTQAHRTRRARRRPPAYLSAAAGGMNLPPRRPAGAPPLTTGDNP
jgi:hypothetical protein